MALIAVATGCREDRTRSLWPDVSVPESLELSGWAGYETTSSLRVSNNSRAPVDLAFAVDAPFFVDAKGTVPGGASAEFPVRVLVQAAGLYRATLSVSHGDATREVQLTLVAATPPRCETSDSCARSTFVPEAGGCVETLLPDGTGCVEPCVVDGRCTTGNCRGAVRSCDDGNACTTDACDPSTGCLNTDVSAQCPKGENPCMAATCDPSAGCGLAPVPDGTLCGEATCAIARVCMAGSCAERPRPEWIQPATLCATDVQAADNFTCALVTDGRVACWGMGADASQPRFPYPPWFGGPSAIPRVANFPGPVSRMWVGLEAVCGRIAGTSDVYCFGVNAMGNLFWRSVEDELVPLSAPRKSHFSGAKELCMRSGGFIGNACAIWPDGGLECLLTGDRLVPVRGVPPLEEVSCVGARRYIGRTADGTVWQWQGSADAGPLTSVEGAVQLGGVLGRECALLDGGTVSCWGDGLYVGRSEGCGFPSGDFGPGAVEGMTDAVALASTSPACAIHSDSTVSCWTSGKFRWEATDGCTARKVPGLSGVKGLTFFGHLCGTLFDGTVFCMGRNTFGEVGVDTPRQEGSKWFGYLDVIYSPTAVRWDGRYQPLDELRPP